MTIKNKDMIKDNPFPDIFVDNPSNPTIYSPNSTYCISMNQTADTLINVDDYRRFILSAIKHFRHSRTYTNYKSFLMELGLDRCQVHSNIVADEMATVEMHHHIITIFDIAIIITEHVVKNKGMINSMKLIYLLKQVHREHKIPIVMLSKTPHQIHHSTDNRDFFIHPNQCIGDWFSFLSEYRDGITLDIAYKILYYIRRSMELNKSNDDDLLKIRDHILDWSGM